MSIQNAGHNSSSRISIDFLVLDSILTPHLRRKLSMETSNFTNSRHQFRVLDFVAAFAWKTDSSISFSLGRYRDTLSLADYDEPFYVGENGVFDVFGWLDIQHPCQDHIKARIRSKVSPEFLTLELL